MSHFCTPVLIHGSQFPGAIAEDLAASLRSRRVNHKFHYDSVKQVAQWLEIHQAYSPAVTEPACGAIYTAACEAAAGRISRRPVDVIGLGCGGGWKDAGLLRALRARGVEARYWAVDSSVPMTLVARANTTPEARLLVCDLASPLGAPAELVARPGKDGPRLVTFYGMLPNFEPDRILPVLGSVLGEDDLLLFSANLAPGPDYASGTQSILHLYDNKPTLEWLMIFLLDLGFERTDGELHFSVRGDGARGKLLRIEANFVVRRDRRITVSGEDFLFQAGESIRLFFSYRHTPELARREFGRFGMEIEAQWINSSGEEGVFLARKQQRSNLGA